MVHVVFFIYVLSMLAGFGGIVVLSLLMRKYRISFLRMYLLANIAFSVLMLLDGSFAYARAAGAAFSPAAVLVYEAVIAAATPSALALLVIAAFILIRRAIRPQHIALLIGASFVYMALQVAGNMLSEPLIPRGKSFMNAMFICALLAINVFTFMNRGKIFLKSIRKGITAATVWVIVMFPPAVFFLVTDNALFSLACALYYCFWNILNIRFSIPYLLHDYRLFGVRVREKKTIDEGALKERYGITRTEYQIITLLAEGYNAKEIADVQGKGHQVVLNQISAVYQKTGVNSRVKMLNLVF
ncbi:MAG: hypothetical protein AABZ39_00895 [Spirochaetota bacterium]